MKKWSAEECSRRRAELERLSKKGPGEENEALRARFSPDSPEGAQLYESFTDGELLELLRREARRLGRSPAQGEVFWVYRSYLRARFRNWPTALRMAGLSRSAGRGGRTLEESAREEEALRRLLAQVREKGAELGRLPHPTDLPEVCQALNRRYRTWGEVLMAAGAVGANVKALAPIRDLEPEYRAMLENIRAQAESLNRAPQRREVDPDLRGALIQRCGSWRNALYQIGLEPVRRISPFANTGLGDPEEGPRPRHRGTLQDCYYRLLRLEEQTKSDLELVRRTAQRLGRPPTRHEIPAEARKRLQNACGSWSNALYQLNLHTNQKTKEGTPT